MFCLLADDRYVKSLSKLTVCSSTLSENTDHSSETFGKVCILLQDFTEYFCASFTIIKLTAA